MSNFDNGAELELAQKFKEKVLARKRGAGTRQPKFRGFSIEKATDIAQATTISGIEIGRNALAPQTSSTATAAPQQAETTALPNFENVKNGPRMSTNIEGLNEKYKERLKARFRGAGAHQSDFRGFTLKPTKDSDRGATGRLPGTMLSPKLTRETSERAHDLRRPESDIGKSDFQRPSLDIRNAHTSAQLELSQALNSLSIDKDSAARRASRASSLANGSRRPTPILNLLKDTRTPAFSVPISSPSSIPNPSTDSQRVVSVGTGADSSRLTTTQAPSIKQAWSTNRMSGISPNSQSESSRDKAITSSDSTQHSEESSGRVLGTTFDRRPVIEDTIDDTGFTDDYGVHDPIPELIQKNITPAQTHNDLKRTSISATPSDKTNISTRRDDVGSIKRRRLILEEEPDENEDPSPIYHNKMSVKPMATSSLKKKFALPEKMLRREKFVNIDAAKAPKPKDVNRIAPASLALTSAPGKGASTLNDPKPLRQATLVQLSSRPLGPEHGATIARSVFLQQQSSAMDTNDNESDIEETITKAMKLDEEHKNDDSLLLTKKAKGSRKGISDQTVENFKQLQIHCLKFGGSFNRASRPATDANKERTKESPMEEDPMDHDKETPSAQEAIQSILEIDNAPLSEMDVIAEAVRDVADKFIETIDEPSLKQELLTLRENMETLLIEQVDTLDDYTLLKASARKAAALKKELRTRLLETQRRRQKTREELKRVRVKFEREERVRRRLEDTHTFLADLEALRDQVVGSDDEEDKEDDRVDILKTGLQSMAATVGRRCGSSNSSNSGTIDKNKGIQSGMLGTLEEFNELLESMEKSLRTMPLITYSQKLSTSRFSDDDEEPDLDDLVNF
ncbi:hypothetical protein BX616_004366 [Lobosporangium transversale]|uniref:Uncharacterized protein n=1 Tax=Lobosporangium transversale TaxID=64571 RepID=A0A1Y2GG08_9FUNG|nr:hypothetical protein BCR41DRAFT_424107 [Lobosporangium transversale]KAF9916197.1 hypothetical protein BX616_004366 [Lobosporangium transversale]ORZ09771.1 hypothetical protein BCR41DRAFT_424107 [Lobosporangium transversale]|eukprot:XP_021879041.1 hypothetical protein BCR41DRAFT_424107 [Lobosporangium transversale]